MTRFGCGGVAFGVSLRTLVKQSGLGPPLAEIASSLPPRNDTIRGRWRGPWGVIANASEAIWGWGRRWAEIVSSCLLAMTRFEGGGVAFGVSLRTVVKQSGVGANAG